MAARGSPLAARRADARLASLMAATYASPGRDGVTGSAAGRDKRSMRTAIDEGMKESLQIDHVDIAPVDAAMLRNFISQTSLQERTTLYLLAKYYFSGQGAILDLGTAAGGTAASLALGLRSNSNSTEHPSVVHTFDQFAGHAAKLYNRANPSKPPMGSDIEVVENTIAPVAELIKIHEADLSRPFMHHVGQGKSEIVHIDVAKSLDIWKCLASELSRSIIPERTIWILQDFGRMRLHFQIYGMQYVSKYGEFIGGSAPWASLCFKFRKEPSNEDIQRITDDDFTLEEKISLIDDALAANRRFAHLYHHNDPVPFYIGAKAFCYLDSGQKGEAVRLIESIAGPFRESRQWRKARKTIDNA